MSGIYRRLQGATLCALAIVISPAGSAAQDTRIVTGVVSDSSGQAVGYVTLDGGAKYRTITNAVGEFRLIVPQKVGVDFSVRRIGFAPTNFRVLPGADTTIQVTIEQLAVMMSTQFVRAQQLTRALELRGFYDRMLDMQRGALVGSFITPEEIELRNPQRVTQLLEQRNGVRVQRMGSCQIIDTCYRILGTGNCAATVYLDGQRLNRLSSASNDPSSAPTVDDIIPVTGVSGIEVYPRGSSAPPKYQSFGGTCAVVVIWTK